MAHVQVLEWYFKSGYKFNFKNFDFENVIYCNNFNILDWFLKSKLCVNYYKILNYFECRYFEKPYNLTLKLYTFLIWMFLNLNNKKMVLKIHKKMLKIKIFKFKTKNNYIKGYNKN